MRRSGSACPLTRSWSPRPWRRRTLRSLDAVLFGSLALALAFMPALRDAGWVVAIDLVAASRSRPSPWPVRASRRSSRRSARSTACARSCRRGRPARQPALRGLALGAVVVLPFGGLFWSRGRGVRRARGAARARTSRRSRVGSPSSSRVLGLALGLALAAKRVLRRSGRARAVSRLRRVGDPSRPARPPLPRLRRGPGDGAVRRPRPRPRDLRPDLRRVRASGLLAADRGRGADARRGRRRALAPPTFAALGSERCCALLLGGLCLLTLVTVASALHRLSLYEDAFGLTRPRLAAETLSLALGGLFVLVLIGGILRLGRRQVVRAALAGLALGLLAFSLSNPDGRDRAAERRPVGANRRPRRRVRRRA